MIKLTPTTLLTALTLALTTGASMAQQQTFYGPDGRVVGRSSTDSAGTVTHYDAQGRVIARESTSGGQTTVYDDKGRTVGRYTTSPQR